MADDLLQGRPVRERPKLTLIRGGKQKMVRLHLAGLDGLVTITIPDDAIGANMWGGMRTKFGHWKRTHARCMCGCGNEGTVRTE